MARLGAAVTAVGTTVYVRALLPNQVHVSLRRGPAALPRVTCRFLIGYALAVHLVTQLSLPWQRPRGSATSRVAKVVTPAEEV